MNRIASVVLVVMMLQVAACGGGPGVVIPPGNQTPNAVVQASATSGDVPLAVNFSAANSSDPDGIITQVAWDLDGNGTFETNNATAFAAQTFNVAGSYTISVAVTDNGGATDTASIVITATTPGGGGVPPIVEPAEEDFVDRSGAGDNAPTLWLKNFYKPLPPPFDIDRVYQNDSLRAWADEVFRLTNVERANAGLPALIRENHLEMVAQAHCRDMALRDYFAHSTPEFFDAIQRMNAVAQDSSVFIWQGENIAANQQSPAEVVQGWMNSEGHRLNILRTTFTHMGIGLYYDTDPDDNGSAADHDFQLFYAQVFASFKTGRDPNAHDWLEIAEAP